MKRRITARKKFDKLLRQERSAIKRHDFKRARSLIDKQDRILVKLQKHKVQVRKHGR